MSGLEHVEGRIVPLIAHLRACYADFVSTSLPRATFRKFYTAPSGKLFSLVTGWLVSNNVRKLFAAGGEDVLAGELHKVLPIARVV